MWAKLGLAALMVTTVGMASDVSARVRYNPDRGLSAQQFCGGQLPAWGRDACGFPERSHGPGSCWRRLPYRPGDNGPRMRWIC